MSNSPEMSVPNPLARRRAVNPRKQRLGVILFLLAILAVFTALCVAIAYGIKDGPIDRPPAVGAGANHTGMYNEHMKSAK